MECTKVSLIQYNSFNISPDSPPWFCTNHYSEPFKSLSNEDLNKILFDNRFENYTKKQIKLLLYDANCAVCKRKIKSDKIAKALPCNSCYSLVHQKCSGISNYDLNNSKPSDFQNWECKNCHAGKFACSDLLDEELIALRLCS